MAAVIGGRAMATNRGKAMIAGKAGRVMTGGMRTIGLKGNGTKMLTGKTQVIVAKEIHGRVGQDATLIPLNASQPPMATGGKLLKVVFGARRLMQQSRGQETMERSSLIDSFVSGGVNKAKDQ